jgi:hypothetical protein
LVSPTALRLTNGCLRRPSLIANVVKTEIERGDYQNRALSP